MPPAEPSRVMTPASYVAPNALTFGALGGVAQFVDSDTPLPVRARLAAATAAPMNGTTAASGSIGPFVPELGRAIWVTLSGEWTGTAALLRSTDGGATRVPLTVGGQPWGSFAGNANEPVVEESDAAASYYLDVALTAGTLAYRVAQ